MDRSKVHTLRECLDAIETMEKLCVDKFNPRACKNVQTYYRHYCYKTFYKEGISSEKIVQLEKPRV